LVSVQSAMMGRPAWTHLDTWNVNHFREVNWGRNLIPTPQEANDKTIVDKYRALVAQIKQFVTS
jgi:hypothetical protein